MSALSSKYTKDYIDCILLKILAASLFQKIIKINH